MVVVQVGVPAGHGAELVTEADRGDLVRQARRGLPRPGTIPKVPELKIMDFGIFHGLVEGMAQGGFRDRLPALSEYPPIGIGNPSKFGPELV